MCTLIIVFFFRIDKLDTYLFVSVGQSVSKQDKIKNIFLNRLQNLEAPKASKVKKSTLEQTVSNPTTVNDGHHDQEAMLTSQEHLEASSKISTKISIDGPQDGKDLAKEREKSEKVEIKNEMEEGKANASVGKINVDYTIPKNWKAQILDDGRKVLVSPSGALFLTRRLALKQMLESKEFTKEEVEEMRGCLVHEGWIMDNKLPSGWMMKVAKGKEIILLSDAMKQFGMKMAIASMEKSGRFSKEVIDGLKELQKKNQEDSMMIENDKSNAPTKDKEVNNEQKEKILEERVSNEEKIIEDEVKKEEEHKELGKVANASFDEKGHEKFDKKERERKNQDITKEGGKKKPEEINEEGKTKVEKGEEKRKEAENEEKPNLPPGWTFSLSGKVEYFVLLSSLFPIEVVFCFYLLIINLFLNLRSRDQMAKNFRACDTLLPSLSRMAPTRRR